MKTPPIPPLKMPDADLGQYLQRDQAQYAKTKDRSERRAISDTLTPAVTDLTNLNKLERSNTQFHNLAQQIRNTKETMERIDANLVEMKDALERIVKIYPPYPPGSAERIKALRQFTAIRNMIDQLTAPQGNGSIDNVMADPAIHPHAGSRMINFNNSGIQLNIHHQPVHTGKNGLDLPNLSIDSSDEQISNAIEKIGAAQKTLTQRQQAFLSDANGVISKIG